MLTETKPAFPGVDVSKHFVVIAWAVGLTLWLATAGALALA